MKVPAANGAPPRSLSRTTSGVVVRTVAISVGAALLMSTTPRAGAQTGPASVDYRTAENAPNDTKSATELNKELSNPISTLWSITFHENTYWLNMPPWPCGSQPDKRTVSTRPSDITDQRLEPDQPALQHPTWAKQVADRPRRGSGLSRAQFHLGTFSAAVVVDGWIRIKHYQPAQPSVFCRLFPARRMERRYITEHVRELVRE